MMALVEAAVLSVSVIAALLATAVLLLIAFLLQEARTPEPMVPLTLWRNRVIAAGNVMNLAFGAVMMGLIAFLPIYVQGIMGATAFVAAAVLTAMSVMWSGGAIVTGRLMLRTSYRTSAATGGIMLVIGSLMIAALDPATGLPWLTLGALLAGTGLGCISNSVMVAIQATVEWDQRGVATSSVVFTRMIGQAVGTAIFGGILNAGVAMLPGGAEIVNRVMEPAQRLTLSPAEYVAITEAIGTALHRVFILVAVLAVVLLAISLWLPAGLSPVRGIRSLESSIGATKPRARASDSTAR
jgi:MFS family permease